MSRRSIPLFRGSGAGGYSLQVRGLPGGVTARKRSLDLRVEITAQACTVQTLEGPVAAAAGDAIITGTAGERWPVHPERFQATYQAVPPTHAGQSGTYRTLPIEVLAVPMQASFEVLLSDGVSLLRGGRGDWLVDYGDGSLGIVSQAVFPAVYEIVP